MEERTRVSREEGGGGGPGLGSIFDPQQGGPVTVVNGPYAEQLPAGGMTVGALRGRYRDQFDIDPESLAVLDGDVVDDDTVVQAGQLLRFSRRAGEKGTLFDFDGTDIEVLKERLLRRSPPVEQLGNKYSVEVVGPLVRVTTPEMERRTLELDAVLGRLSPPRMSTEMVVLPDGVKAVLSQGHATIWVHQTPPGVHNFRWIADESGAPFGPEAEYRDVKIALPYVLVLAVFLRDPRGHLQLRHNNECFFRNEPLKSLDDELLFPALLNCSKHASQKGRPLSWICTQHMDIGVLRREADENRRMRSGMNALLHCLFDTAFNYSSDHHEGSSWYTASRDLDTRIGTIEKWESATAKDPLFATQVSWRNTGHTLKGVAERIISLVDARPHRGRTSTDLAREVLNHGQAEQCTMDLEVPA